MEFRVGDIFRSTFPGVDGHIYKIHICSIVDDDMVVFKWYGKHKQGWHYEIEHKDILEIKINKQIVNPF